MCVCVCTPKNRRADRVEMVFDVDIILCDVCCWCTCGWTVRLIDVYASVCVRVWYTVLPSLMRNNHFCMTKKGSILCAIKKMEAKLAWRYGIQSKRYVFFWKEYMHVFIWIYFEWLGNVNCTYRLWLLHSQWNLKPLIWCKSTSDFRNI